LAICVSDGAGFAANGGVGARIVSRFLANWLASNADAVFDADCDDRTWAIAASLRRLLRRAALSAHATFKSYACTLVALLVTTHGKWLTAHVGDGGIVGSFAGKLQIISGPRKGEFANETFFVTDADVVDNIRIQIGACGNLERVPKGFALFTDGVECSVVNRQTGQVSQVLAKMFDWLLNYPESDVAQALESNLRDVFRERSNDDCSLVIVVRYP